MEIKIDKNVPMPKEKRGKPCGYPWRQMEIGDSFFVSEKGYSGFHTWTKRLGIKISIRKVTENGVTGVRVWRVA